MVWEIFHHVNYIVVVLEQLYGSLIWLNDHNFLFNLIINPYFIFMWPCIIWSKAGGTVSTMCEVVRTVEPVKELFFGYRSCLT
jgi:hypothetical protein